MSAVELLTLNAGSSNIKTARFDAVGLHCLERLTFTEADAALAWLHEQAQRPIAAVAHRVVHGGDIFRQHSLITPETLEQIRSLSRLAPLHQPPSIHLIEASQRLLPPLPHLACFDTVFHTTMPPLEQRFALPESYFEQGYRRYGFHGLSYEHVAQCLPAVAGDKADGRVIAAHLGNGASLCAMHRRRSVTGTMGFSTLDGLMMGTRCGSLDAGLVLHWFEHAGMSAAQVHTLLYQESGLKGVSGLSHDMQELEKYAASGSAPAARALELFAHMAARQIGSLMMVLGGLDALVFTGGIGEHSASMRARICTYLAWLGLTLDLTANTNHRRTISDSASKITVHIIPADEEIVMANATRLLLAH